MVETLPHIFRKGDRTEAVNAFRNERRERIQADAAPVGNSF